MIDELGLVEDLNALLETDGVERTVSLGVLIKSLILYGNLAPGICKKLGLIPKYAHMDSTDFHVDGVYNSREEPVEEGGFRWEYE